MPASPSATAEQIKDANERYHDAAAADYDAKWGIEFGALWQDQARSKLEKALGEWPRQPFGDALEIGSGTGYLSLNAGQQGLYERLVATDISEGMLARLARSAERLGVEVETVRCEADDLPFADESFDLAFGHAVLHHLPDLETAFGELRRVLRPGGTIAFCGEPSRYGDRLAAVPKRAAVIASPLWRAAIGATARAPDLAEKSHDHRLESEVDVHAFTPGDLEDSLRTAGFESVRVRGEELLSSLHGWATRSLEATAEPDAVSDRWRRFAARSYLWLRRIDERLLEPRLPPQLFYNLVLSARKPA